WPHRHVSLGSYSKGMQRIDSGGLAGFGHGAQRADHVEVFLASEIRIKIGFFGNVAEEPAVGSEIFPDVLAVVGNLAIGGLKQAGEHFHGSAFSGPVGTQIAENLAGFEREGYVL